jgi:hypothetical protein
VAAPRITAAVCTFNRAEFLPACLESLAHQHLAPHEYEILIVDNGSTDDTLEVACRPVGADLSQRWYLRLERLAFAAGRVAGARWR